MASLKVHQLACIALIGMAVCGYTFGRATSLWVSSTTVTPLVGQTKTISVPYSERVLLKSNSQIDQSADLVTALSPSTVSLSASASAQKYAMGFIVAAAASLGAYIFGRRSAYQRIGHATIAGAVTALSLTTAGGALAADGEDVFDSNCASCHINGGNVILPGRVLSKAGMEQYLDGGWNKEAIEYQIRNGKSPMPAWEGVLSDEEITAVTTYVYEQSSGPWADVR
jgi:cytochrome c6